MSSLLDAARTASQDPPAARTVASNHLSRLDDLPAGGGNDPGWCDTSRRPLLPHVGRTTPGERCDATQENR